MLPEFKNLGGEILDHGGDTLGDNSGDDAAPDGKREPFASGTGLNFGYRLAIAGAVGFDDLPAFLSVLRYENDEYKDRATCNLNELFVRRTAGRYHAIINIFILCWGITVARTVQQR